MKRGKTLALALGLAAGAVLAVVATKSTKRVKQQITKKVPSDKLPDSNFDDSEVHYV